MGCPHQFAPTITRIQIHKQNNEEPITTFLQKNDEILIDNREKMYETSITEFEIHDSDVKYPPWSEFANEKPSMKEYQMSLISEKSIFDIKPREYEFDREWYKGLEETFELYGVEEVLFTIIDEEEDVVLLNADYRLELEACLQECGRKIIHRARPSELKGNIDMALWYDKYIQTQGKKCICGGCK